MARPPIRPKAPKTRLYDSVAACEDRDNATEGYHVAEVTQWPPPRSRVGEPVPSLGTTCVNCGVNVTLYATNDPEVSNWKIVVLEAERRTETSGKK